MIQLRYMNFGKLKLLSLCLIGVFLLFAVICVQKVVADVSSTIAVTVSPDNPSPNENVDVTLSSYANNLDSVSISWILNGKAVLSGIGKKTLSITAPAAGSISTIVASISLPDGVVEKKIIIRPSVMVLLWQATDSYVPPFYKGKAMPSTESEVRVVAMPEIRNGKNLMNPKNMIYSWQQDNTDDAENSGYAKNSYTYVNDYLRNSNNISVTASTIDGQNSSGANIQIGQVSPFLIFYKTDNKIGTIWENVLPDTHTVHGNEVVFAAPYFISPKELLNPILNWAWSLNGNEISVSDYRKYMLPIQVAEGTSGTSTLRLDVSNPGKLFQNISKEVNIEF